MNAIKRISEYKAFKDCLELLPKRNFSINYKNLFGVVRAGIVTSFIIGNTDIMFVISLSDQEEKDRWTMLHVNKNTIARIYGNKIETSRAVFYLEEDNII